MNHSTLGIQVSNTVPVQTHFSNIDAKKSASVVLTTARVWIISPTGRAAQVRALLDQGSTWSFISQTLAKVFDLKCTQVYATMSGLGGVCAGIASSSTEIRISPWVNGKTSLVTNALVVPRITDYVPQSNIALSKRPHFQGLQLADNLTNSDPIHLLIGADLYGSVLLDGLKKGFTGDPVAQNTIFGWVVSGPQSSMVNQSVLVHHCTTLKSLELSLRKFWEVEEVKMPQSISIEEQACEDYFVQTHTRNPDGRYIVRLPFK